MQWELMLTVLSTAVGSIDSPTEEEEYRNEVVDGQKIK